MNADLPDLADLHIVRPGDHTTVARLCRLGGKVIGRGDEVHHLSLTEDGSERETETVTPMGWVLVRLGRKRVLIVAQPPEQPQPP